MKDKFVGAAKQTWENGKNAIDRVQYNQARNRNIKELRRLGEEIPDNLETFEYQAKKQNKANEKTSIDNSESSDAEIMAELELDLKLAEELEISQNDESITNLTNEGRRNFATKGLEYFKNLPRKQQLKLVLMGAVVVTGAGIAVGAAAVAGGIIPFSSMAMSTHVMGIGIAGSKVMATGQIIGGIGGMGKAIMLGTSAVSGATAALGAYTMKQSANQSRSNQSQNSENVINGEIVEENYQGSKANEFAASHKMYDVMEKGFQNQKQTSEPKNQTYTSRKTSIFAGLPKFEASEPTPDTVIQDPIQQLNNPNKVQNIINAERKGQDSVEPVMQSESIARPKSEKKPSPLDILKKGFEGAVIKGKEKLNNLMELSKLTKENKYQKPLSQDQIRAIVAEKNLNPELAGSTVSEKDLEVYLAGKEIYSIDGIDEMLDSKQVRSLLDSGNIKQENIGSYSTFNFSKAAEQVINDLGDPNNMLAQKINSLVIKRALETSDGIYSGVFKRINDQFPLINNPKQILETLNKNDPMSSFSKTKSMFDSKHEYLSSYGEILSAMKEEIDDLRKAVEQEAQNAIDGSVTELYYELTSINNSKSPLELTNDDIEVIIQRDRNAEASKLPKNSDNLKLMKGLDEKYSQVRIKLTKEIEQRQERDRQRAKDNQLQPV
jgi:hypothetical protein